MPGFEAGIQAVSGDGCGMLGCKGNQRCEAYAPPLSNGNAHPLKTCGLDAGVVFELCAGLRNSERYT